MIARMPILTAAICLVAAPVPAVAQSIDRTWADIAAAYDADLKAEGTIGSSMAVTRNGKLVKEAYYGLADRDAGRKVDADTLFHWASISKMFTAVAVLQLRDRGKLSLDDRIIDYLPETKQIHNPFGPMSGITLRHLITHSSGLRGATFPWRGDNDWAPHEPAKWSQVAAMMPYTEIEFEPGSKFSYSNPGTSMLGRVVEEITGDDIESYVTKNILMPLGMSRSYYDKTPYFLLPHRSNNYYIAKGAVKANGLEVDTGATNGNGGLNGPLSDLLKFAHFLLGVNDNGNYETVLSRKSLLEMRQPLFAAEDDRVPKQQMGLSTFTIDQPVPDGRTLRFVGHTGGQMGFATFVYIQPESNVAVVFGSNTRSSDAQRKSDVFAKTRTALFTRFLPLLGR